MLGMLLYADVRRDKTGDVAVTMVVTRAITVTGPVERVMVLVPVCVKRKMTL